MRQKQNKDDVLLYHIQNGKRLIEYMSINDIRKMYKIYLSIKCL